ncbi:MAG TPA: hypothetical protein DEA96_01835, partial [Leptospiraceae bacterium]|nr:hypothetical protein [Leptospiraceae bacterium]
VLGSRARPSVSVALGRSYWRDSFQESLLANVGFFPGLHIIWDSDGYGKATLSPAYLLDGAVSGNNPPGLGSRSQSGILARNSLDSNRYGSSAFYTVGSTWQFGFGVRRHSLRKNARLYHPGVLNYIHFFAGYRGDRLRAGLGFSRVTGELQKARRTRAEKNQDGFEPIPRPGGPRKELSLDISAAELHGTIEWKEDQWSLGFSFFLPESNFEKDGNTDIGYIHPGSPPYLNELSRYFGISSGFQLCNRVRYCSEIKLPSRNLYAKLQLRFKFLWNGYNASLIALYSSARIQRGQGVQNSVPDREAPDYLEWQFRIKKSWDFLRRGSLSINYGRIYIRKTRPSRAFAEYFRIGLDISLYDSTEKDGERYLDKQEENARKAKESLNE